MHIYNDIRMKFLGEAFEFSRHAVDQSILRRISMKEIREAVKTGEIIEEYPDDENGGSCLVLGYSRAGNPFHIHCSYPTRPIINIITVYQPEPALWINNRIRR
jgi:hypothetical protein